MMDTNTCIILNVKWRLEWFNLTFSIIMYAAKIWDNVTIIQSYTII